MSYVLDALKKSDQERQRRSAPGIGAVHEGMEKRPKNRTFWPCILTLVLLLNAGLMVWWIHPWRSEKVAAPVPKDSSASQGSSEINPPEEKKASGPIHAAARQAEDLSKNDRKPEAAVLEPIRPSEAVSVQPKVAPSVPASQLPSSFSGSKKIASLGDKALPRPEGGPGRIKTPGLSKLTLPEEIRKSVARVGKAKTGSAAALNKHSEASDAGLSPERLKETPTAAGIDGVKRALARHGQFASKSSQENSSALPLDGAPPSGQPAAVGSKRRPGLVSDSASQKGVARFQDLPAQIRNELPNLSFSMLIYSKNPAERVARVNGQVVHEGEDITAGLKLEQITPDGAILEFRGYRFQKGVL